MRANKLYNRIKILFLVIVLIPLPCIFYDGRDVNNSYDFVLLLALYEIVICIWFALLSVLIYYVILLVYKYISVKKSFFLLPIYFIIESIIEISFFSIPFLDVKLIIFQVIAPITVFINLLLLLLKKSQASRSIKKEIVEKDIFVNKKLIIVIFVVIGVINYLMYISELHENINYMYYVVADVLKNILLI